MLIFTSLFTTAASAQFIDVPPGYWAYDYIMAIYNAGITTGYGDGRYGPEDFVTREQMAAFLVRFVEGEPPGNYCDSGTPFPDVTPSWSCKYIKRLKELGITTGYGDGRYGPLDLVTREQMAAFIGRAINEVPPDSYCDGSPPFPDISTGHWSCKYIKRLKERGITTGYGDGRYGPLDFVTRAQMAAFLARAFVRANNGTMTIELIDAATIKPVPGVIVQLDGTGNTTAVTNASGIATFTGIPPGAHDVHVFPTDYTWVSAYQVNTDRVVVALESFDAVKSYINFTGTVNNVAVGYTGAQFVLKISTDIDTYYTGMIGAVGAYDLSIPLLGVAPGTMVSGTLYVLEQGADPVTGVVRVVDSPNIGTQGVQQSYTTVAFDNISPITLDITYNTSKPPLETLAHLNSVTPPPGVTWNGAMAYADMHTQVLLASLMGFGGEPVTLEAFDPFNVLPASHSLSVFDTFGSWVRTESVAYASYVGITAAMTSMPSIAAGQSGDTIEFTPATGTGITMHGVSIADWITGNILWNFYGPAGTNNFRIPTLPVGVTPVLSEGSLYGIASVSTILGKLSYDRLLSFFGNQITFPLPWELATSEEVDYTR